VKTKKKNISWDIWNLSPYFRLFIYLSIPRSLAEPLTTFWNPEWVGNTALDSCKAGFRPLLCFLLVHVSLSSGFVTQFTRTSEDNVTTSYKRHCMETYVCPGGWRMEAVNIYFAFVIERMFGIQAITKKGVIESVVECVWNLMAHGDARRGKWRGNWRMEWVASTLTLLGTWCIQHY